MALRASRLNTSRIKSKAPKSRLVGAGEGAISLTYSVQITGLTEGIAQIGVELTAVVGGWTGDTPSSVAYQWLSNGSPISGATGLTYTPAGAIDLTTLTFRATPSELYVQKTSLGYAVQYAPPTLNAAPTASGVPVIGQTLSGVLGTFNGSNLTTAHVWQVSDDGVSGWADTANTSTTSPAQSGGKYYRLKSSTLNSGGTVISYSNVIGPAVPAVVTMNGLTSGQARIGAHAGITLSVDQGTITAREWGSTDGGSDYGTGTNPANFEAGDGDTLYGTVTVGGIEYTASAPIRYNQPVAAGELIDKTFTVDIAITTIDVSSDFTVSGDADLSGMSYALTAASAALFPWLDVDPDTGILSGTPTGISSAATVVIRGSNSGGYADTAFQITVAAAVDVPSVVINSIIDMDSDGVVEASVTVSEDGDYEAVLFYATEGNPGAAAFNGGGAPTYIDLGPVALTASDSSLTVAIPDGLEGSVKLGLLPEGGGDGDVAVSDAFHIDTTDSVLSPVSFTDSGGEGINWGFTPDEDSAATDGYRVSIWSDGTNPTDEQIESGTGSLATITGTAAASVAETGNFPGLGDGTYQPTIYYKDAFGNEDWLTYSDVTVASAAGLEAVEQTRVIDVKDALTTHQTGLPFTAQPGSNRLLVAVATYYQTGSQTIGFSFNAGAIPWEVAVNNTSASSGITKAAIFFLREADIPVGEVTPRFAITAGGLSDLTVVIYEFSGVDQTTPIVNATFSATLSGTTSVSTTAFNTSYANSIVLTACQQSLTGDQAWSVTSSAGGAIAVPEQRSAVVDQREGYGAIEQVPSAGTSVSHTYNWTQGSRWGWSRIEIKEAA